MGVRRCEAWVKATVFRERGRCEKRAVDRLDGKWVCRHHSLNYGEKVPSGNRDILIDRGIVLL